MEAEMRTQEIIEDIKRLLTNLKDHTQGLMDNLQQMRGKQRIDEMEKYNRYVNRKIVDVMRYIDALVVNGEGGE